MELKVEKPEEYEKKYPLEIKYGSNVIESGYYIVPKEPIWLKFWWEKSINKPRFGFHVPLGLVDVEMFMPHELLVVMEANLYNRYKGKKEFIEKHGPDYLEWLKENEKNDESIEAMTQILVRLSLYVQMLNVDNFILTPKYFNRYEDAQRAVHEYKNGTVKQIMYSKPFPFNPKKRLFCED